MNYERIITELGKSIAQHVINEAVLADEIMQLRELNKEANEKLQKEVEQCNYYKQKLEEEQVRASLLDNALLTSIGVEKESKDE